MAYTNPHYPRMYQILITGKTGKGITISDLHCTFVVKKRPIQSVNFASLVIYNLSEQTMEDIFQQGAAVIISAGYENGDYGQIFSGTIFQPLYDRENVTDYKLELHCIDGDSLVHGNFTQVSLAAGYKYADILTEMCRKSHAPITVGTITDGLLTQTAPRGMAFHGDPWEMIQHIAKDNNATAHILDGKLQMQKIDDTPSDEVIVISPESGLIGTPQQVDYGFSFRALLNPKIALTNPWTQVKIDNSIIRQQKAIPGQSQYISMLDQDMTGIVIETTYTGDTRGNDWYVDAICVNRGGKSALGVAGIPELISTSQSVPW